MTVLHEDKEKIRQAIALGDRPLLEFFRLQENNEQTRAIKIPEYCGIRAHCFINHRVQIFVLRAKERRSQDSSHAAFTNDITAEMWARELFKDAVKIVNNFGSIPPFRSKITRNGEAQQIKPL